MKSGKAELSRAGLQRGEYGLWLYDTVKERLGNVSASDFKDLRGAEDHESTLGAVATRLTILTRIDNHLYNSFAHRNITQRLHPAKVRHYTRHNATFAKGDYLTHLGEGLKAGFAFPNNTIRALIFASQTHVTQGDNELKDKVQSPSDALGKPWFNTMLKACARTGNGYWASGSTTAYDSNYDSYSWMSRNINYYEIQPPFQLDQDGNPEISTLLRASIANYLVSFNAYSGQNMNSSGCPMSHDRYKTPNTLRGYVGNHQKMFTGEETSPVVEVEFSGIELCADALHQAYSLVTGTQYVPPKAA